MDPEQALADLMEISSQVEAAVVLDASGAMLASAGGGEQLAATVAEALGAASSLRPQSPPTELEVSARGGSLFVARDGERTVAATTGTEPVAGLVLYDLRTVLRRLAEAEAGAAPEPAKRRRRKPSKADAE